MISLANMDCVDKSSHTQPKNEIQHTNNQDRTNKKDIGQDVSIQNEIKKDNYEIENMEENHGPTLDGDLDPRIQVSYYHDSFENFNETKLLKDFRIQIQFPISDLTTIIFQIELEKLNSSTDVINKLELDLEVSNILL